jgi:hypothetical protein
MIRMQWIERWVSIGEYGDLDADDFAPVRCIAYRRCDIGRQRADFLA